MPTVKPRKDGVGTRARILEAACSVFATRGFREATVAGICSLAGANVAAVNYHFRDKNSLYIAVWRHSAREEARLYPMDGGIAATAPAPQRLRGIIGALVRRLGDQGALGNFQKLKSMELAVPTGLIAGVVHEFREPFRENLKKVIRELLGDGVSAVEVEQVERVIVAQCMVVRDALRTPFSKGPAKPLSSEDFERWTSHITHFSLAGIRDLKRRLSIHSKNSRSATPSHTTSNPKTAK